MWLLIAGLVLAGGGGAAAWTLTRNASTSPPSTSAPTVPGTAPSTTAGQPTTTARPTTTTTRPATTTTVAGIAPGVGALGPTCTSAEQHFSIQYPVGWHAEQSLPAWICARFDSQPLGPVPADTELPPTAVLVFPVESPFVQTYQQLIDPASYQVVDTSNRNIYGYRAVALETVQVEDLALPAGTRYFRILIDRGNTTWIVETSNATPNFDRNKLVVDAMSQTLQFH